MEKKKNPTVAAILSFLIGGLGQFYNGEFGKGLIFLVIELLSIPFTFGIGYVICMIISIVDAYNSAKRINSMNEATEVVSTQERIIDNEIVFQGKAEQPAEWNIDKIQKELNGLKKLYTEKLLTNEEYMQEISKLKIKLIGFAKHEDKYKALVLLSKLRDDGLLPSDVLADIKECVLR